MGTDRRGQVSSDLLGFALAVLVVFAAGVMLLSPSQAAPRTARGAGAAWDCVLPGGGLACSRRH